jgi:hypothetical protein
MKNLYFLLFLLFSSSCFSQPQHSTVKVAEIQNGNPVFLIDTSVIKTQVANFVNNSSELTLSYDKVEINYSFGEYYLVLFDYSYPGNTSINLILDNGFLYEAMVDGRTRQCTCTGCTTTGPESAIDCQVKYNGVYCYCTACPDGVCTKTVTVTSTPIIFGQ